MYVYVHYNLTLLLSCTRSDSTQARKVAPMSFFFEIFEILFAAATPLPAPHEPVVIIVD